MPLDVRWLSVFADVPATRFEVGRTFWTAVTGWPAGRPAGAADEYVPLVPPAGDRYLWLQRVDRGAGGWHLDLHVLDVAAAASVATALGARPVRETAELVVLETPAGQPFCLALEDAGRARQRPAPVDWPTGRSCADQLCFDIPAAVFEAECAFWSALTGWPQLRRNSDSDEFERLAVPEQLAVQFLFQRLGADDPAGARAHADLASDDRAAEVARHERLGATRVRTTSGWTTLRDPAGLLFCVTDRRPGVRLG